MLIRLLELSWLVVLNIHDKKQLHEVIDISSETLNRHIERSVLRRNVSSHW
jgi:hypothetical protein